jgi:hypothetical protein
MLRAFFVAAVMVVAVPAFAQVRVITGDVEHIYGPGGQVIDSRALQEQNARAEERMRRERYERRMRAIREDYERAQTEYNRSMADIEERRGEIEENAARRARGRGWNLH